MNIRKIERSDLSDIVSLIHEFAEFEGLSSYFEIDENKLHAAMFADGAVVEGFIAVDEDIPLGYALFYPGFSSFRGERGLNLEDLYVREEYRGKGTGQMLLRKVAETARIRGLVRIDLMVNIHNSKAMAFYTKLGARSNSDERHFKFSDEAFIKLSA